MDRQPAADARAAEGAAVSELAERLRSLAAALEPFAGQVYFSRECHAAYEALGFGPSRAELGGVAMPDGPAYFCSRGSVMGQVPGEVIASAFGVFNPAVVVPFVDTGWALTDAATIGEARTDGAIRALRRMLGDHPDGLDRVGPLLEHAVGALRPEARPLFAGLSSLELPGDRLGDAWRRADMLREWRGDAHVAAWSAAGFDATEIGLLTELYWGLPMRTYIRTRAWSDEELDAAEARLEDRGLVAGGALTDAGRAAREAIEVTTDLMCRPISDALGADLSEVVEVLGRWSRTIRDVGGYPAAGPHDLAGI